MDRSKDYLLELKDSLGENKLLNELIMRLPKENAKSIFITLCLEYSIDTREIEERINSLYENV